MIKIYCDRCGKEILEISMELHYKKRKFKLSADSLWFDSIIEKELCEDCKISFLDWLNKKDDG